MLLILRRFKGLQKKVRQCLEERRSQWQVRNPPLQSNHIQPLIVSSISGSARPSIKNNIQRQAPVSLTSIQGIQGQRIMELLDCWGTTT
jgi:hypothetical protein